MIRISRKLLQKELRNLKQPNNENPKQTSQPKENNPELFTEII